MITPFDISAVLLVLLAMLISKTPKREAAAFCLLSISLIVGLDWYWSGFWFYASAVAVEICSALAFILAAFRLNDRGDRFYYLGIATLFTLSTWVTLGYLLNVLDFALYGNWARLITLAHIAFLLGASDGTVALVRSITGGRARYG